MQNLVVAASQSTMNITFTKEFITPELARVYLTRNTKNRSLRSNKVNKVKRDILAGNWALTHQGVAFNNKGELIDGQHRLNAVVLAEKGCWMYVARYVEDIPTTKTMPFDTQTPRTASDLSEIPKKILEVARCMLLGADINHRVASSATEVIEFAEKHMNLINHVCDLSKTHAKFRSSAPIKAAVALLCIANPTEEEDILEQFRMYVSMNGIHEMWPSVSAFLRYSTNNGHVPHGQPVAMKRAWVAFRPGTRDRVLNRLHEADKMKEEMAAAMAVASR